MLKSLLTLSLHTNFESVSVRALPLWQNWGRTSDNRKPILGMIEGPSLLLEQGNLPPLLVFSSQCIFPPLTPYIKDILPSAV